MSLCCRKSWYRVSNPCTSVFPTFVLNVAGVRGLYYDKPRKKKLMDPPAVPMQAKVSMIGREQRRYPRVPVPPASLASITERPLAMSDREGEEEDGVVKNVSQGGCQITTPLSMRKGCVLSSFCNWLLSQNRCTSRRPGSCGVSLHTTVCSSCRSRPCTNNASRNSSLDGRNEDSEGTL